jgi:hypothetical protein
MGIRWGYSIRPGAGNGPELNNRIRECGAKRSSAPFRSHAAGYPHGAQIKERKNMKRKAKHNSIKDYPDVLRVDDVGEIFHLSDRTVKEYLGRGELRGRKVRGVWLVAKGEIYDFIERYSVPMVGQSQGGERHD